MLKGSDVFTRDEEHDNSVALAEVYEAHADAVWRWLHALGVREADLDDATQEVFVVVFRKYAAFDHSAKVTTWLFAITMRVASQFRRRAHVRREQASDDLEALLESHAQRPDDAAAASQARELFQLALETMDEQRRAVLVLYELEGHTLQEIAELTGAPLQTVYTRLRAAREQFRAAAFRLAGRTEEEGPR